MPEAVLRRCSPEVCYGLIVDSEVPPMVAPSRGPSELENIVIRAARLPSAGSSFWLPRTPAVPPLFAGLPSGPYINADGELVIDRGAESPLPEGSGGSGDVGIRPTERSPYAEMDRLRAERHAQANDDVLGVLLGAIGAAVAVQELGAVGAVAEADPNVARELARLRSVASLSELESFRLNWQQMQAANDPAWPGDVERARQAALEQLLEWLTRLVRLPGGAHYLVRILAEILLLRYFGEGALRLDPEGNFTWDPLGRFDESEWWVPYRDGAIWVRPQRAAKPALEVEIFPSTQPRLNPRLRPLTVSPPQWNPRFDPVRRHLERPLGELWEELYRRIETGPARATPPDFDIVIGIQPGMRPMTVRGMRLGPSINVEIRIDVKPTTRPAVELNQLRRDEQKRKSMQAYIAGLAFVNRTWGNVGEIGDFAAVLLHSFEYADGTMVRRWDQLIRDWDSVKFDQVAFITGLGWEVMGDALAGAMGEYEKRQLLKTYGRGSDLANAYGLHSTRYQRVQQLLK